MLIQNINEFNTKWFDYLEEGHYGLALNDRNIIDYLDTKFTSLVFNYPLFKYSQIKLKFGTSRAYISNVPQEVIEEIEEYINNYYKNE